MTAKQFLKILILLSLLLGLGSACWKTKNTGIPLDMILTAFGGNAQKLYVGGFSGLYLSQDLGDHWTDLSRFTSDSYRVNDILVRQNEVLLATSNGIFYSSNGGNQFQASNQGIATLIPSDPTTIVDVRQLAISGNRVYAATFTGLYCSDQFGRSWYSCTPLPRGGNGIDVVPAEGVTISADGSVWAGMQQNGLYQSTDQGRTWTVRNEGVVARNLVPNRLKSCGQYLYYTDQGKVFFRESNLVGAWRAYPLVENSISIDMTCDQNSIWFGLHATDRTFSGPTWTDVFKGGLTGGDLESIDSGFKGQIGALFLLGNQLYVAGSKGVQVTDAY